MFDRSLLPGLLICAIAATAAQFLADHYGAPSMLMALLLGLAVRFLAADPKCAPGIAYSSQTVLRIGVALLGVRISADLIHQIGFDAIVVVSVVMGLTILIGLGLSSAFGQGWRLGVLTACAVAVCGVSAAMAIAAVIPKDQHSERNLTFTVIGVTILSTIAMIAYPLLANVMGWASVDAGFFLGATIHDVAQVVGAGYSISPEAGDAATVVKLWRVVMLAPIVIILSVVFRHRDAAQENPAISPRRQLVPTFVGVFVLLATVRSLIDLPDIVVDGATEVSRWALLMAITGVGMRTSIEQVQTVGQKAIALIVLTTAALAAFVAAAIWAGLT